MASERGAVLRHESRKRYFTLSKPDSDKTVWIINPEDENIVPGLRVLTREQWVKTLDYNIARLNKL